KTTLLSEDDPEYKRLYEIMYKSPLHVVMQLMILTLSNQPTNLMKLTKVPSLNLSGEKEVFFPQYLIAYTAVYLSHFKHAVIPNASTYMMVDQPEITAGMITAFLQEQKETSIEDPIAFEIEKQTRMYVENVFEKGTQEKVNRNELQVDLLHHFRVFINGKQVLYKWNQRYAKEILIFLVFHPTTTREQICEHLWPELPIKIARTNLRVYLFHLKKLLNAEEPILVIDRESVQLDADVICYDIEFIDKVKQTVLEINPDEKYKKFKSLFDELPSSGFLTSTYDDWFLLRRDKLEMELVHLTITVSKLLIQLNQYDEVEQILVEAISKFEDNEKIYDLLIDLQDELQNDEQYDYWIN